MKKVILVIALFFAFVSGNFALAGTQHYTSPWRKPYYEGETGGDIMEVNINATCSVVQISGYMSPSSTWPAYDTYLDIAAYNMASASPYTPVFNHLYGYYTSNNPSFYFSDTSNAYWGQLLIYMNISNGSTSVTVDWF